MNYYIDPVKNELFAYDDEQVAAGFVREGLESISAEQADALRNPPPTFDDQVAANTGAIQKELDRQAAIKGYDDIKSAVGYVGNETFSDPIKARYQAEGNAYKAWRFDVWAKAERVMDEVKAGTRPMPTPDEAVAMMPPLVLP